jgi:hypothetical protein
MQRKHFQYIRSLSHILQVNEPDKHNYPALTQKYFDLDLTYLLLLAFGIFLSNPILWVGKLEFLTQENWSLLDTTS